MQRNRWQRYVPRVLSGLAVAGVGVISFYKVYQWYNNGTHQGQERSQFLERALKGIDPSKLESKFEGSNTLIQNQSKKMAEDPEKSLYIMDTEIQLLQDMFVEQFQVIQQVAARDTLPMTYLALSEKIRNIIPTDESYAKLEQAKKERNTVAFKQAWRQVATQSYVAAILWPWALANADVITRVLVTVLGRHTFVEYQLQDSYSNYQGQQSNQNSNFGSVLGVGMGMGGILGGGGSNKQGKSAMPRISLEGQKVFLNLYRYFVDRNVDILYQMISQEVEKIFQETNLSENTKLNKVFSQISNINYSLESKLNDREFWEKYINLNKQDEHQLLDNGHQNYIFDSYVDLLEKNAGLNCFLRSEFQNKGNVCPKQSCIVKELFKEFQQICTSKQMIDLQVVLSRQITKQIAQQLETYFEKIQVKQTRTKPASSDISIGNNNEQRAQSGATNNMNNHEKAIKDSTSSDQGVQQTQGPQQQQQKQEPSDQQQEVPSLGNMQDEKQKDVQGHENNRQESNKVGFINNASTNMSLGLSENVIKKPIQCKASESGDLDKVEQLSPFDQQQDTQTETLKHGLQKQDQIQQDQKNQDQDQVQKDQKQQDQQQQDQNQLDQQAKGVQSKVDVDSILMLPSKIGKLDPQVGVFNGFSKGLQNQKDVFSKQMPFVRIIPWLIASTQEVVENMEGIQEITSGIQTQKFLIQVYTGTMAS